MKLAPAARRSAIAGAVALLLVVGLLVIRNLAVDQPREQLRATQHEGVRIYEGSWHLPRGGPYFLGFESPDGAAGLFIDGKPWVCGTGLKVNLPVVYTVGGVFTIQYIELELAIGERIALNALGGFSLQLGPFSAAVDQIGVGLDISTLIEGDDVVEAWA